MTPITKLSLSENASGFVSEEEIRLTWRNKNASIILVPGISYHKGWLGILPSQLLDRLNCLSFYGLILLQKPLTYYHFSFP